MCVLFMSVVLICLNFVLNGLNLSQFNRVKVLNKLGFCRFSDLGWKMLVFRNSNFWGSNVRQMLKICDRGLIFCSL